jgi:hypothetical protein
MLIGVTEPWFGVTEPDIDDTFEEDGGRNDPKDRETGWPFSARLK